MRHCTNPKTSMRCSVIIGVLLLGGACYWLFCCINVLWWESPVLIYTVTEVKEEAGNTEATGLCSDCLEH
jgi:hypothetical protein